ncbi:hypothetical protein EC968_005538 [Mortierella alpina]|nr:hypothetical protein EC968_005538 [Mortierella alpina]
MDPLRVLSWSLDERTHGPRHHTAALIPPYLFIARALDQKLSRIGLPEATTRLHFDGARSIEKQHEHQRRQRATRKQMAASDKFFIEGQQIPLRKPHIEAVEHAARNVVHIPQAARHVTASPSVRNDPCIALTMPPTIYVLSNDSDWIVYLQLGERYSLPII